MPRPVRRRKLTPAVLDAVAARLNGVDFTTLVLARQFRARKPPDAASLVGARKKAVETVRAARVKAAAGRPDRAIVDRQTEAMADARQRIIDRLQDGSHRTPQAVRESFLKRAESTPRTLARGDRASLLIRSRHKDLPSFSDAFASVVGLSGSRDLSVRDIEVKLLLAAHDAAGAVFSVRLPVRRSGVFTEIHNFAWALRKTGRFLSVRADGSQKALFSPGITHARRAERVFGWPLVLTEVVNAHKLAPQATGRALGEGIVVAHPDTGWAPHPQYNRDQIDLDRSFNAGSGRFGGDSASHSRQLFDPAIMNIAHGTATGSVIVGGNAAGDGSSEVPEVELLFPSNALGGRDYGGSNHVVDPKGALIGVAPLARVRPIKFIDDVHADIDRTGPNGIGVVRVADEDLVVSLDYARTSGAHVVSLSVGGLMHDAVREAIDLAVENNVIVVSAAGQTYTMEAVNRISEAAAGLGIPTGDSVVLPAAYANVIAVAGCSSDGRPWDESLRGPNVDITAPADGYWVADFDVKTTDREGNRLPLVEAGSGTSFAAAFMAGVAALWLAHWGRDELLRRYRGTPLAWVFRHQLQRTANAAHADAWDHLNYGPGVVNVRVLLEEPLPRASDVRRPPATTSNIFTVLSGVMGTPASESVGDAWAIIYDLGLRIAGTVTEFSDAAWAATRGLAEVMLGMGEQALEELFTFVGEVDGAADRTARDAIDAVTDFVQAAANLAEDALQSAAAAGDDAVDAAAEFAEDTVDAIGEAAEEVVEFLFGWAS